MSSGPLPSRAVRSFSMLLVCAGNICRSPAAEFLLRTGLGDSVGVSVASAGLEARVGEPVSAPMAALLLRRGIETSGFAARQLHQGLLRDADLILTMTAAQRAAVVTWEPASVRRSFTLREFAALAVLAGPESRGARSAGERLTELVQAVPRLRPLRPLRPGPAEDDIEDPYRQADAVFGRVTELIEQAVSDVVEAAVTPSRQSWAAASAAGARS